MQPVQGQQAPAYPQLAPQQCQQQQQQPQVGQPQCQLPLPGQNQQPNSNLNSQQVVVNGVNNQQTEKMMSAGVQADGVARGFQVDYRDDKTCDLIRCCLPCFFILQYEGEEVHALVTLLLCCFTGCTIGGPLYAYFVWEKPSAHRKCDRRAEGVGLPIRAINPEQFRDGNANPNNMPRQIVQTNTTYGGTAFQDPMTGVLPPQGRVVSATTQTTTYNTTTSQVQPGMGQVQPGAGSSTVVGVQAATNAPMVPPATNAMPPGQVYAPTQMQHYQNPVNNGPTGWENPAFHNQMQPATAARVQGEVNAFQGAVSPSAPPQM